MGGLYIAEINICRLRRLKVNFFQTPVKQKNPILKKKPFPSHMGLLIIQNLVLPVQECR